MQFSKIGDSTFHCWKEGTSFFLDSETRKKLCQHKLPTHFATAYLERAEPDSHPCAVCQFQATGSRETGALIGSIIIGGTEEQDPREHKRAKAEEGVPARQAREIVDVLDSPFPKEDVLIVVVSYLGPDDIDRLISSSLDLETYLTVYNTPLLAEIRLIQVGKYYREFVRVHTAMPKLVLGAEEPSEIAGAKYIAAKMCRLLLRLPQNFYSEKGAVLSKTLNVEGTEFYASSGAQLSAPMHLGGITLMNARDTINELFKGFAAEFVRAYAINSTRSRNSLAVMWNFLSGIPEAFFYGKRIDETPYTELVYRTLKAVVSPMSTGKGIYFFLFCGIKTGNFLRRALTEFSVSDRDMENLKTRVFIYSSPYVDRTFSSPGMIPVIAALDCDNLDALQDFKTPTPMEQHGPKFYDLILEKVVYNHDVGIQLFSDLSQEQRAGISSFSVRNALIWFPSVKWGPFLGEWALAIARSGLLGSQAPMSAASNIQRSLTFVTQRMEKTLLEGERLRIEQSKLPPDSGKLRLEISRLIDIEMERWMRLSLLKRQIELTLEVIQTGFK